MEIKEVKQYLGQNVAFKRGKYLLTACILRRTHKGELFYQVELQDTTQPKSIIIARLKDVEAIS